MCIIEKLLLVLSRTKQNNKNHKTKNGRQNRHLRKMDMNGESASKHNYLNKV